MSGQIGSLNVGAMCRPQPRVHLQLRDQPTPVPAGGAVPTTIAMGDDRAIAAVYVAASGPVAAIIINTHASLAT
jgi:hypothetical protein